MHGRTLGNERRADGILFPRCAFLARSPCARRRIGDRGGEGVYARAVHRCRTCRTCSTDGSECAENSVAPGSPLWVCPNNDGLSDPDDDNRAKRGLSRHDTFACRPGSARCRDPEGGILPRVFSITVGPNGQPSSLPAPRGNDCGLEPGHRSDRRHRVGSVVGILLAGG
jgi:hypothetical protein